MGFDEGSIILDSENGAYYAGQTVFGRIVFDQGKPKTIHGIYISCKGFCKVHWTSTETRRVDDRTVHDTIVHESYEEYFNRKTFIFGDASGEHHLQQGHHEFRFDCPIPNNCPSSFDGTHGHVRYRIKAVMVTTGMFSSNKEKLAPFRVHAPLDLNQNPYCKEPIDFEIISSYCCWCVSSGSSEIKVKLPVAGYCPGQTIPIEVSVVNLSNVEINTLKFKLRKNVRFEATSRVGTKIEDEDIAVIKKGPIAGGTTRNWTLEMQVPVMEIYNMNACRFINIEYYFHVSTEVGDCHEDEDEFRHLIFGTIPLVGFQDNIPNPLQDQLPKPMTATQNLQVINAYPPPPIINQPTSNAYPNGGYPQNTPYPGAPYPASPNVTPYPTSPNVTPYPTSQNITPYPTSPNVTPYPGAPNTTPYPAAPNAPNQPYPNVSPYPNAPNQPYPNVSPYPNANPPYPNSESPYPTNTPYSPGNVPQTIPSPVPSYPGRSPSPVPPYPGVTSGQSYHGSNPNITNTSLLKTGSPGFVLPRGCDPAAAPLLPPGANVPYPTSPPTNPYATASAPEPSTPGGDSNNPDISSPYPAYNPEFMNSEKKDEKHN